MNIGFDMDGVIVDFMEPICSYLGVDVNNVFNYRLEHQFPDKIEEIKDFYGRKGYFRDLRTYPGSTELIRRLLSYGHNVLLCSKPAAHSSHSWIDKIDWIKEYLPELADKTILTRDKSVCKFDIFIDDDPDNLDSNISIVKVLFDQPWNRKNKKYLRAYNYINLEDIINGVYNDERVLQIQDQQDPCCIKS
jgi:5'(3')-deoxyribonucleotidase